MGWGVHDYPGPPPEAPTPEPVCPRCLREFNKLYRDRASREVLGCDVCIEEIWVEDILAELEDVDGLYV